MEVKPHWYKYKARIKSHEKVIHCICIQFNRVSNINAQDYKTFRVGLGLGNAVPNYDGYVNLIVTLEPQYRLNDDLALGFRFENFSREDIFSSDKVNTSLTLNGQYFLSTRKFRPFLGLGSGLYVYDELENNLKFGLYPRVGFDFGHISLSMDYNFIILSETNYWEYIRNYLTIRAGFFLGGGKIKYY